MRGAAQVVQGLDRLAGAFDSIACILGDLARGRVEIGPIVIVSEKRESEAQKNAFELGRDYPVPRPPKPVQRPERRLKLV